MRGRATPRRRRHASAALLLTLLVGVSATVAAPDPARAGWAAPSYATATVSTGTLAAVPQVACGAGFGLISGDIPITWTASPAGGNLLTPQSYTLRWSGTAGSGSTTVAGVSGSVTGATLTLLGTSTVTVTANDAGWTSPDSTQTRTITTIAGIAGAIVLWTCR